MKHLSRRLHRGRPVFIGLLLIALGLAQGGGAADSYAPATTDVSSTLTPAVYSDADLIDYIAARLSLPVADEKRIHQELAWYARHPDYLGRVFTRARRYLPYIVEEIEKRGMPLDLALLPVVESAYDPFAYSHGRAAGLWQFIPGTGRMYGLRQDWWYDGRRDVVESTRAALDYLEAMHRKFDGDWLLAIASYNSGSGKVRSAIRRNKKQGKPTDFWHLNLPRETRAYVPKLIAMSRLVAERYSHDFVLPYIPQRPYFAVVPVDGQIDLALAAELAGVDIQEIYQLNPGFNRWATSPSGPHRLVVPFDAASVLSVNLAATPASERVRWERYRIKTGEALSVIATRFQTTVPVLKEVNGLRTSRIRAGDYLMIPIASRDLSSYSMSADSRLARKINRDDGRNKKHYTVQRGDSLWEIGRDHGVNVRALASWNGLAPGDVLREGRQLVIRGGSAGVTPPSGPNARRRIQYTVRSGDSLSEISARFRVSVSDLREWNRLDDQKYLQPGQKIVMFVDVTRQSGG